MTWSALCLRCHRVASSGDEGADGIVELFTAVMRVCGFGGAQSIGAAGRLLATTVARRMLQSSSNPAGAFEALYVLRFIEDVCETSLAQRPMYVKKG